MKKFIKRLFGFVVCLALAVALVRVGPYVYERFFGGADTQWISEQFSQTLHEKNELVVYEVEVTGQETVTQDAWLLGTVQKVEMPYTFRMSFTVDLSLAVVSALDDGVEVRVPPPVAAYPKLIFLCQVGTKKFLRFYKPFIGGRPPVNGLLHLY